LPSATAFIIMSIGMVGKSKASDEAGGAKRAARLWWIALALFCAYVALRVGGSSSGLSLLD